MKKIIHQIFLKLTDKSMEDYGYDKCSDLWKKWCKENDDKCKEISVNAKKFYNKYLCKSSVLDYFQQLFINISKKTGNYKYNYMSPLEIQQIVYRLILLISTQTHLQVQIPIQLVHKD